MSSVRTSAADLACARSLLFVPGNRPERFDKAFASGADGVILDLEDAVPADQRDEALVSVRAWLLDQAGQNNPGQRWVRVPDARACLPAFAELATIASLTGFVLPKVESPADLQDWSVPLIAQIESARGVLAMPQIAAASEHLHVLAIGPEDLAASLGTEPGLQSLMHSCALAVLAARAAGRHVMACPGSIGEFRDLQAWRATMQAGRELGSDGMMCIHPVQVPVTNEAFSPDAASLEKAARIVEAASAAEAAGQAAISLDGKMIDPPVVVRAERLLARARLFRAD